MTTDIITAKRELAALLEAPAAPVIGRPAKPVQASDLALVINKHPETIREREQRVYQLRRENLLVPVDEAMEFPEWSETTTEQDAFNAFDAINWS